MWKKIAPLLIVLSVALNAAFIGVWAVQAIRLHWPATHVEEEVWCPLHRQLKVTHEQWRQIEPRLAVFRRDSQALCKQINELRSQMIDLIAGGEPDRQAIAAKQEKIRAGQQRMQQLVIGQLLAEKEVLTADQQKELFDMLRKRSGCAGPGRMLGLSDTAADNQTSEPDVNKDR
jgi:Spy/CpxP family protein refolding chaperone